MNFAYSSIRTREETGVLFATLDAGPLNLIGVDLVRDLVSLVDTLHTDPGDLRVVVIDSASPDFFSAHVDLTAIPQYTAEAAKAGGPGDASLGMFLYKLAHVPVITIAKVRGRARGGGNELALACDMIFAARENAVFGHPARRRRCPAPDPAAGQNACHRGDHRGRRLRRRPRRALRLDQPRPARRRTGRLRRAPGQAHRRIPTRGGQGRQTRDQRSHAATPGERPLRLGHVPQPGRTARKPRTPGLPREPGPPDAW
jgi:hypothetical protein